MLYKLIQSGEPVHRTFISDAIKRKDLLFCKTLIEKHQPDQSVTNSHCEILIQSEKMDLIDYFHRLTHYECTCNSGSYILARKEKLIESATWLIENGFIPDEDCFQNTCLVDVDNDVFVDFVASHFPHIYTMKRMILNY